MSRKEKLFFPIEIENIDQLELDPANHLISFNGHLEANEPDNVAVKLQFSKQASEQLLEKLMQLHLALLAAADSSKP